MFVLHLSNRTENLLQHLAAVLAADEKDSVFAPELFLIQSQGMERMISQFLARTRRSWANYRFLLPLGFIDSLATMLAIPARGGFDRQTMVWRIDEQLRDNDDPLLRPVQQYLSGDQSAVKRFQLARQLANLFDQYQLMRPDMLAKWQQGERATSAESEGWQMLLWQRLTSQLAGEPHRGQLLQEIIGRLAKPVAGGKLPQRLAVFGLHLMPPLFLDCLNALASQSDIHLFLLSPCRQYWGDVEDPRRQLRRQLGQGAPARAENDQLDERHPLLASLGQQGRDFQKMLLHQVDFSFEPSSYENPFDPARPRLLHALQADILVGEPPRPGQYELKEDDRSIQVVSCHSRLREIAVLKDHLLQFLHEDPDLELRDIIVMAPDIQEYAALIPAVFADLPHAIADRSLRRRNGVLAAFIAFIKLLGGRFGWSEVLDLLTKECVAANFGLDDGDLEIIHHWVTTAGIRWGLSAEHRQELGLPGLAATSWAAGLERLLMGYAIDTEEEVAGIFPYDDIEGGQGRALGVLCRFMAILDQSQRQFQQEATLSQWGERLLGAANVLFGDGDEPDLLELRGILSELVELPPALHASLVDLTAVASWLEQAAGESRSSSGFLRGQLTFCSMLPMRSIPFKLVCLIGLNDGAFPKNDRHATFDLLAGDFRVGDRSPRADDRYQFLEAILAARSALYLSFVGQSIRANENIPPSVVVTELLEVLTSFYGVRNLIVSHPLHPFSSRYFDGKSPALFSYDDIACATARRFHQPADPPRPWWSGDRPSLAGSIDLHDLLAFLGHPQRWFVRRCLAIRPGLSADLPAEREDFRATGLALYDAEQRIVEACQAGKQTDEILARLVAAGRWALGSPGQLSYAQTSEAITTYLAGLNALNLGQRQADIGVDLAVGPYRLTGLLTGCYEKGIILARYANLKGKDLLQAWIFALLAARLLPGSEGVWFAAKDQCCHCRIEDDAQPDLLSLVELYVAGCRQPSALYVEAGVAYLRQLAKRNATRSPLAAARQKLQDILSAGYDPDLALLLRGSDAEVLGTEFERLCLTILLPIWRATGAV